MFVANMRRLGELSHDIWLEPDQFSGEGRKLTVLAIRPPVLDDDILALNVPEVAESLPHRLELTRVAGSGGDSEDPAARNFSRRGLRAGAKRRANENEDDGEQPEAHYSITSSARARIDAGIVRPSAPAVFRLMTSWYLEA